jgi:hypothetical protein
LPPFPSHQVGVRGIKFQASYFPEEDIAKGKGGKIQKMLDSQVGSSHISIHQDPGRKMSQKEKE